MPNFVLADTGVDVLDSRGHKDPQSRPPAMLQSNVVESAGHLASQICERAGGEVTKAFFCTLPLFIILALLSAVPSLVAQQNPYQVPATTPLSVQLEKHVPMKMGEALECHLLYPVYAKNQLVIPAGSILRGSVVALKPDRSRRIHSKLWGDFTPFYIPVVHFDQLEFPDGTIKQIATKNATGGAPVLHLSTPGPKKSHSLIYREIAAVKEQAKQTVALVTAPGRKDRLVQFLYTQLPYHPQRIETATMWTAALAQPLSLKPYKISVGLKNDPPVPSPAQHKSRPSQTSQESAKSREQSAWHLRAYLEQTISSATEKQGNTFEAIVAEPVFNSDHTVAVPEGSVLVGTITQVKPARSFGRAGKLRFDFRELKLPNNGASQNVQGSLAGADASKSQQLQIDAEGGVHSKPQNRVIVPLVLTFLAGRALDEDGSLAGNAAVASNGFGIIGRVAGMVGGSRDLAAGIGFYAAGLSFSERWLVKGQNVVFPKNTRIEVTTVPSREPLPAVGLQSNPPERH
ncbi:MAG: hypothetical protein ACRD3F_01395 [Acidobacteriaceae bacterium]